MYYWSKMSCFCFQFHFVHKTKVGVKGLIFYGLLHIFSTVYTRECLNVFFTYELRVLNLKLFGDTKIIIYISLILSDCATL